MIRLLPADPGGIAAAVEALGAGRLVLHPTETVVSLSGDPYRLEAVEAARALKGYRDPRPFLCLVADEAAARRLAAEWPDAARRLAAAFWPGALTFVIRAAESGPGPVTEDGRLALRPASDPVSRRLLAAWEGPLFSTSANRKGDPPALRVSDAIAAMERAPWSGRVAVGLEEPADAPARRMAGEPSTIVDLGASPPRVIRAGAIPRARLVAVVPDLAGP